MGKRDGKFPSELLFAVGLSRNAPREFESNSAWIARKPLWNFPLVAAGVDDFIKALLGCLKSSGDLDTARSDSQA